MRVFRRVAVATLTLGLMLARSAAAETITIRSGNDANGPLPEAAAWTAATCWHNSAMIAPLKASGTFTASDYATAASGAAPLVVMNGFWTSTRTLTGDPLARWVSCSGIQYPVGFESDPRSVLYCIPFTIHIANISTATLDFEWAADDRLGDNSKGDNKAGVYINETPVTPIIAGGGFTAENSASRDVKALVHTGTNLLYIYQRDTDMSLSGVIFSAKITVCPPDTQTIVMRSGSVSGQPGSPGQVADQTCLFGTSSTALRPSAFVASDFAACTSPTYVAAGPWTLPTGMDPLTQWLSANINAQNQGNPPGSTLFAQTFSVNAAASPNGTLTLQWAADDGLGDPSGGPNTAGVYLNGSAVSPSIDGTGWTVAQNATRSITVVPGAVNTLYLYDRDLSAVATGIRYKATIKVPLAPCTKIKFAPFNPNIADVYWSSIGRAYLVFDRFVDPGTANNPANYALASFGAIHSATLQDDGRTVLLITDPSSGLALDGVSAVNIAAADTDVVMPLQSRNFWSGLASIPTLRAPDPDSLAAPIPSDRSTFAGPGSSPGDRVTIEAVCAGPAGGSFAFLDPTASIRGGLLVSPGASDFVIGHKYLLSGSIAELADGIHLVQTVGETDEGPVSLPDPVVRPIPVLRATSIDVTQSVETGLDFAGMLAELDGVTSVAAVDSSGFMVVDRQAGGADSIEVFCDQLSPEEIPAVGSIMTLRGVLIFRNGQFGLVPRGSSDVSVTGFEYLATGHVTADNEVMMFTANSESPGAAVTYAGVHACWPPFPTGSVNYTFSDRYLYLACWSDHSVSQGLLHDLQIHTASGTVPVYSGNSLWRVAPGDSGVVGCSNPPPATIAACIAARLPSLSFVSPTNGCFNPPTGGNACYGVWGSVASISTSARWTWFDSGLQSGADAPFAPGFNHRELLIFRLDMNDLSPVVAAQPTLPSRIQLRARPNPSPAPDIAFTIPERASVDLAVFDVSGRVVRRLVSATLAPGPHNTHWDGNDEAGGQVRSGVYFLRLRSGVEVQTAPLVLLR